MFTLIYFTLKKAFQDKNGFSFNKKIIFKNWKHSFIKQNFILKKTVF